MTFNSEKSDLCDDINRHGTRPRFVAAHPASQVCAEASQEKCDYQSGIHESDYPSPNAGICEPRLAIGRDFTEFSTTACPAGSAICSRTFLKLEHWRVDPRLDGGLNESWSRK